MRKIFWLFVCVMAFVSLLGCGNSLVDAGGQVTFNGTPLEQGEIRFLPSSDSPAPSAAAIISNGHFQAEVTPGSKRVEIFGYKVIGQRNIGTTIDIKEQVLPERYNTRTELTCEITSGGGPYNFELQN